MIVIFFEPGCVTIMRLPLRRTLVRSYLYSAIINNYFKMQLSEAIKLIQYKDIMSTEPQTWTDLGCGTGLFTQALAKLLDKNSTIYAVDKNIGNFRKFSTTITIELLRLDFIKDDILLSDLHGIVMANSLHYVKDKIIFLNKLIHLLRKDGYLLLVEYDTDKSNPWVPYPLSFSSLNTLFKQIKHKEIIKLQEHSSVFGRANMYASLIKL